jgi:phosphoglycerate dehydrogenase-like enzyme
MKGEILITDSLFIFPEHETVLRDAGYDITRLDKPDASEAELIQAIEGKVGYILGGIEKATDKVIDAGKDLKAIVFTGSDWQQFITGHELATKKGISIANTPGANTSAVAEYTVAIMLAMVRNIFELGRTGNKKFETTHSLNELTIGIVGLGRIGTRVAEILKHLGAKKVLYWSRNRKTEVEKQLGIPYQDLPDLLSASDVVTIHISKEAGNDFIGEKELRKMKDSALLINCGFTGAVNRDALLKELQNNRLRAAQDDPFDDAFDQLPLSAWFNSNAHTAFNTFEANKTASDMATRSLLNLLASGEDEYRVN